MRTRVLSVCVAALCAAACEEKEPRHEAPVVHAASSRATVSPTAESKTATPSATTLVEAGPAIAPGEAEAAGALPDPLAVAPAHRRGMDHLARAEELRAEGNLEGALTEARRAVFDHGEEPEALAAVAQLAKMTTQYELAATAWERLGAVKSEDAVPLVQQARMRLEVKDYDGAIAAAISGLERDGENAEGYQVIGRARLSQGELPAAISAFQMVIELQPEHGHALNNLGFAYLRANRDAEAVEVLERAALLLPHVAYVHNNLGVALERTGDLEGAQQAFALATSLSPKYVKAHVNAARMRRMASAAAVEVKEATKLSGSAFAPPPLDPLMLPNE